MKKLSEIISKLLQLVNGLEKDKLQHFFVGSVLLSTLLILFNPLISILITILIAAVKEVVWDGYLDRGVKDIYDFGYSVLPCLLYIINTYI